VGGAIAPPAALANAINDALRPLGIALLHSPVSQHRIVEAVLSARATAERTREAA
jgi:carbon-monoxide dehydrogenase large subunit